MEEIPRGEAHGAMLVVSPIMETSHQDELLSGQPGRNRGRLNGLVLARSTVDRAGHIRINSEKLAELWREARILVLVKDRIHATDNELVYHSASTIRGNGEKYFLGLDTEDGRGYFVWHTQEEIVPEENLRTLRQIGASLNDVEAGLAVHAVGLANWHGTHPRCSRCGAPTRVDLGGAVRICDVDGSQHHPRTDPAVIVLVKDEDDRILLGRQPSWAEKRFSNFAGFLEPGESFEQCVLREVAEEAGVRVHSVHYLGSQPWPFPASIMIAFEAATSEPSAARPDGVEITEIRWFSRAELKVAIAAGEISLPPGISVSRRMIEYWYGENVKHELVDPHD